MQSRNLPLTDIVCKLLSIPEKHRNYLHISDQSKTLTQVHYSDCLIPEIEKFPQLGKYRGWILKGDTVVARSFEWTREEIVTFQELKNTWKMKNDTGLSLAHEGTILRIYTVDGEMYVSTHRRLDSKKSKWNTDKTFYVMFEEACQVMGFDKEKLKNENFCFVLLLVHPDNQIVNQEVITPTLYHLDTWKRGRDPNKDGLKEMIRVKVDVGLPVPKVLTGKEVSDYFAKGRAFVTTNVEKKVKYISKELARRLEIRGNHPNIKLQWYILSENKKEKQLVSVLPPQFKEMIKGFEEEKEEKKKGAIQNYLIPLYKQEIEGKKLSEEPYYVAPASLQLCKEVQGVFLRERSKEEWDLAKLEHEFAKALEELPGHLLYRVIKEADKFVSWMKYKGKELAKVE